MLLRRFSLFALCCALLAGCSSPSPTVGVRMNQTQVIGTHNSYHQRAHDSLMKLIAAAKPEAVSELDYGHRPLPEQLEIGVRQLELDCYADPEGDGSLIRWGRSRRRRQDCRRFPPTIPKVNY